MITSLILTLIVLLIMSLALNYLIPPASHMVQWTVRAVIVLIAIIMILAEWGLDI